MIAKLKHHKLHIRISILCVLVILCTASAELLPKTYDIDTGFRPRQNGFSFENYGNDLCSDVFCMKSAPIQNLTGNEMRRLFGDRVCKRILEDGSCELLKVAESWMNEVNEAMDEGHCEGMAVLTALFFAGILDPSAYGSEFVNQLRLEENTALQQEIAYWYATQWYINESLIEEDPATQLGILIEEFTKHPNILIPLGIYKRDFSEGHAILAYAVQQKEDGIYWIMVYDNNYPDEERHLEINTKANTWQYSGKAMVDLEEDLYDGEGDTNPFQIAPINARLGRFNCDFCPINASSPWAEEVTEESSESPSPWNAPSKPAPVIPGSPWTTPAIAYNKIGVNSAINIYIESEEGHKSGYDWNDEAFYKEIPNVEIVRASQRTTAKLPTDLVYYLWLNSPDKEDWLTFDVDITSPGTILYLTDVLESYAYPNLIYTPQTYNPKADVNYETFEVVASPDTLPGVKFVISDSEGEYSFSFATEFVGDVDSDANIDFLIYHDYDTGQLGIEIYAASDEEDTKFENSLFRIHGGFSISNGNGEQSIALPADQALELKINGAFYINYLNWSSNSGYFINADLDGDYELETTLELNLES